ncbi:MAG: hypothetical protein JWN95_1348 [Frankiales bacterium]|nr:hypothetical protein [Frankiales bacterium]
MTDAQLLVQPFPPEPPSVRAALNNLTQAQYGSDEDKERLGPPAALPRPWVPASCGPRLRTDTYQWLDSVADWLNHDYCWQRDRMIPACWPAHPHIVHELAMLAVMRRRAEHALEPQPMEDWHRYSLVQFHDRMTTRLGKDACDRNHDEWPGRTKHLQHQNEEAIDLRQSLIHHDHEYALAEHRHGEA